MMQNNITGRDLITAEAGLISIGLVGTYYKLSAQENDQWSNQIRPDGRPRIPPTHVVTALSDMGGTPGPGKVP